MVVTLTPRSADLIAIGNDLDFRHAVLDNPLFKSLTRGRLRLIFFHASARSELAP